MSGNAELEDPERVAVGDGVGAGERPGAGEAVGAGEWPGAGEAVGAGLPCEPGDGEAVAGVDPGELAAGEGDAEPPPGPTSFDPIEPGNAAPPPLLHACKSAQSATVLARGICRIETLRRKGISKQNSLVEREGVDS